MNSTILRRLGATVGCGLGLALLAAPNEALAGQLTLTAISTNFNQEVGIDYHEPTNTLITSVNYPGGSPYNLERVNLDGTHTQFSSLSGLDDELKIATVRSGNVGGFATGDIFTGNGVATQIAKVSADGLTVQSNWVSLPTPDGLLRGSLYVDRTGVFGGDLIVVSTGGSVWRVTSAGVASKLADVNTHLEGLLTVPNDSRYGPLAGKIIAGAEDVGLLYAFAADGTYATYNVGVNIEDIDLIEANSNFFGVNYSQGRLLGAAASQFTNDVGDILLTQEVPGGGGSGLYKLTWNGSALVASQYTLTSGSPVPTQWEHVTFAPAGVREIASTVPLPTSFLSGLGVLAGLTFIARRRRTPAAA